MVLGLVGPLCGERSVDRSRAVVDGSHSGSAQPRSAKPLDEDDTMPDRIEAFGPLGQLIGKSTSQVGLSKV